MKNKEIKNNERVPMKLNLIGKYPIRWFKTYNTIKDIEEFFLNNPNRKVIIFDTGLYDDDYLEKIIIKK